MNNAPYSLVQTGKVCGFAVGIHLLGQIILGSCLHDYKAVDFLLVSSYKSKIYILTHTITYPERNSAFKNVKIGNVFV